MLKYLFYIGILSAAAADLKISKHNGGDRTVNLELETVLEFDKENKETVKLLNDFNNFIGNIKNVIENKNVSRRNMKRENKHKLADFVENLVKKLNKYDVSELEHLLSIINSKIKKLRGSFIHELVENIDFQQAFTHKLAKIKNKPADAIRHYLNVLRDKINEEVYAEKEEELLDTINSMYEEDYDLINDYPTYTTKITPVSKLRTRSHNYMEKFLSLSALKQYYSSWVRDIQNKQSSTTQMTHHPHSVPKTREKKVEISKDDDSDDNDDDYDINNKKKHNNSINVKRETISEKDQATYEERVDKDDDDDDYDVKNKKRHKNSINIKRERISKKDKTNYKEQGDKDNDDDDDNDVKKYMNSIHVKLETIAKKDKSMYKERGNIDYDPDDDNHYVKLKKKLKTSVKHETISKKGTTTHKNRGDKTSEEGRTLRQMYVEKNLDRKYYSYTYGYLTTDMKKNKGIVDPPTSPTTRRPYKKSLLERAPKLKQNQKHDSDTSDESKLKLDDINSVNADLYKLTSKRRISSKYKEIPEHFGKTVLSHDFEPEFRNKKKKVSHEDQELYTFKPGSPNVIELVKDIGYSIEIKKGKDLDLSDLNPDVKNSRYKSERYRKGSSGTFRDHMKPANIPVLRRQNKDSLKPKPKISKPQYMSHHFNSQHNDGSEQYRRHDAEIPITSHESLSIEEYGDGNDKRFYRRNNNPDTTVSDDSKVLGRIQQLENELNMVKIQINNDKNVKDLVSKDKNGIESKTKLNNVNKNSNTKNVKTELQSNGTKEIEQDQKADHSGFTFIGTYDETTFIPKVKVELKTNGKILQAKETTSNSLDTTATPSKLIKELTQEIGEQLPRQ